MAIFLTVVIIITTISVGLGAFAASITVSKTDKAIIAVPETVYMTPSTGESKTGQYYVNNILDKGTNTVTPEATNGNTNAYVQFDIPGAKDVTIAVNTVTSGIGDIVLNEASNIQAGALNLSYENTSLGSLIDADGYFSYKTAGLYINGTIYAGRTDAYVAYLTQNKSNVSGTLSYTLADGTVVERRAIIDLGLGDSTGEPEEPAAYDVASDLKLIRASASADGDTVTITVTPGKTMAGVYVTTASGATVEIKDVNGTFADRTDAYVAYQSQNTSNVTGTMVVTLADGTVYEYNVIYDLGL